MNLGKSFAYFFAVLALFLLAGLVFLFVPEWVLSFDAPAGLDDAQRYEQLQEIRRTMIQAIGGIVLLLGLWVAYVRARASERQVDALTRQVSATEEGQITDRYAKAVELLAKSEDGKVMIEARVGAVFALERVAKDSPSDAGPIAELLASYVRTHASRGEKSDEFRRMVAAKSSRYGLTMKPDVEAALQALGRIKRPDKAGVPGACLDLSRCDLSGARMPDGDYCRTDFSHSDLSEARLLSSRLQDCNFSSANMKDSVLMTADLRGASLGKAEGLTADQIEITFHDGVERLPDHLRIKSNGQPIMDGEMREDKDGNRSWMAKWFTDLVSEEAEGE